MDRPRDRGDVPAAGRAAAATESAALAHTSAISREQRFFTIFGVVVLAVVFAGFSRTYYLRPAFYRSPLPPLLHLHGALFTAWILLLIAQVRLIATRHVRLHRQMGVGGIVLAPIMVVVVLAVIVSTTRRDISAGAGTAPLSFMTISLGDIALFATFAGLGFYFRRRPEMHKRLMVLATMRRRIRRSRS